MKKSSQESIEESRQRVWQRLACLVPAAIAAVTKRKAELEAEIEAGKKLSRGDRRELDKICAVLDRTTLVPAAIATVPKRKAELEAQIELGKQLSQSDQRELDVIRAILDRTQRTNVCALLSSVGLEELQARLRQVATARGISL